ncbi:hypothetical protein [Fructilactobacillus frigidiflavus]
MVATILAVDFWVNERMLLWKTVKNKKIIDNIHRKSVVDKTTKSN